MAKTASASWLAPGALRLLLAVAVFVSHVSYFNIGRPAVVVFFMLSGFWVTRLYETRPSPSVIAFLLDRFMRVWPLMAIVATAVAVACYELDLPARGSLASTLGLLGLGTRHGDVIGVIWSLDIEMQFYICIAGVLAVVRAVPAPYRLQLGLAALAIVTLAGTWLLGQGIFTVMAWAPSFAVGSMIWLYRWSPSRRLALVSLVAFVLLAALIFAIPQSRPLFVKPIDIWWSDTVFVGLTLVLAPFVAWNVNQPSSALDRMLGDLSYPLYLVQGPIIYFCMTFVTTGALGKAVALLVTIVVTLALYSFVDRPLERARRRLRSPTMDRRHSLA